MSSNLPSATGSANSETPNIRTTNSKLSQLDKLAIGLGIAIPILIILLVTTALYLIARRTPETEVSKIQHFLGSKMPGFVTFARKHPKSRTVDRTSQIPPDMQGYDNEPGYL